jgi:thioredoxin-like negative regulator of GroEL
MNPVVNGLEQEYEGRITFTRVDIDTPESRELKQKYNFRGQPYFVLLDPEGQVVDSWYGLVEADDFRSAFDALVAG